MNTFLKYCGIFIQLIGVLFLAIPFFMKIQNNATLLTGWILVIAGFLLYIIINKRLG